MLIAKKKGKSKVLPRGSYLFESGAFCYSFYLSPKYPRIIVPSARLLNQINKICETKLQTYPSSFAISK